MDELDRAGGQPRDADADRPRAERAGRVSLLHHVRPGDDRVRLKNALTRARAEGHAEVLGLRLDLHRDEPRICDVYVQHPAPNRDDAGNDAFVVSMVDQTERLRSISERERTHRELQAKERENLMLGEAVRLSGQLLMVTDELRRLVWVNPAFERVTGYAALEVGPAAGGPAARPRHRPRRGRGAGAAAGRRRRDRAGRAAVPRPRRPALLALMEVRPLPRGSQLGGGRITVATEITERHRIEDAIRAASRA
ncbi:MAG: hypothetical protein MZW92_16565 [Comamonadaceae bacterium]|nr:hypothetical protein [Comamonadaceae bacterium]